VAAIERGTGQHVPKRQAEELARRAAADFERFYEDAKKTQAATSDLLVISADGKGVVMRPDALRPATAKAAASKKLATRLSKGERPYRKRRAEVGAVYDPTVGGYGTCPRGHGKSLDPHWAPRSKIPPGSHDFPCQSPFVHGLVLGIEHVGDQGLHNTKRGFGA
jgi:hypothetical protein